MCLRTAEKPFTGKHQNVKHNETQLKQKGEKEERTIILIKKKLISVCKINLYKGHQFSYRLHWQQKHIWLRD
jgi:hypothetical protein